ncbi:hypothetical protein SNE40_010724 [Patella caerulea]|uniref:CCHC-type domain-containing protein n=1 Tax=Patella caerulea TaxID=87958 RepID=A0AAN8JR07_PATCE
MDTATSTATDTKTNGNLQVSSAIQPPPELDFNNGQAWSAWIRRFDRYRLASGLDQQSEDRQVSTLIYTMGQQADDIYNSFDYPADEQITYDMVKTSFDGHFIIRKNVIFERANFNKRSQKEGESADNYINSLFPLSEYCEYGMLREQLIRDKIVVGIRDEKLSQKLQLDSQLSLKKAIDMVRQSESIIAQNRILRETNSTTEVDAIKSKPKQKFKPPLHKKASNPVPAHSTHANVKVTSDVNKQSCQRCGNKYHARSECPAKNSTCRKCKKLGHWDKVCRSRHVNTIEENNSYAFMGLVSTNECQDIFQRKLKLGC